MSKFTTKAIIRQLYSSWKKIVMCQTLTWHQTMKQFFDRLYKMLCTTLVLTLIPTSIILFDRFCSSKVRCKGPSKMSHLSDFIKVVFIELKLGSFIILVVKWPFWEKSDFCIVSWLKWLKWLKSCELEIKSQPLILWAKIQSWP